MTEKLVENFGSLVEPGFTQIDLAQGHHRLTIVGCQDSNTLERFPRPAQRIVLCAHLSQLYLAVNPHRIEVFRSQVQRLRGMCLSRLGPVQSQQELGVFDADEHILWRLVDSLGEVFQRLAVGPFLGEQLGEREVVGGVRSGNRATQCKENQKTQ